MSSPTTAKRIIDTPKTQDALDAIQKMTDQSSEKSYSRGHESIITPRDTVKNLNSEQSSSAFNSGDGISYRTPNTKNVDKEHAEIYAQKELTQAGIKENFELGRRENTFNNKFYNKDQIESLKDRTNRSEENDDNIRVYANQFCENNDIIRNKTSKFSKVNRLIVTYQTNSGKKLDDTPSDTFNANESVGIHTAKNSPLESYLKDNDMASSEKYSVISESAEKHLSYTKNEYHPFDYNKPSLNNIRKNLHSTLQEDLENSINSPETKGFMLKQTSSSQEVSEDTLTERIQAVDTYLVPEYPNMVSPAVYEKSPSNFDDSK